MIGNFKNLVEFNKAFNTEQKCIDHLIKMRWKAGIACPHCGNMKYYTFAGQNIFKCAGCLKKFNIRTKSIFEGSNVPLQTWFLAIYLAVSLKRGISSAQLARDLGVTQKTAWFMLQRLRTIFGNDQTEQLSNIVEADEVYLGGKSNWKHADKKTKGTGYQDKLPIVGLLERDNKVRTYAFPNLDSIDGEILRPLIRQELKQGSTLVTDSFGGYNKMETEFKHVKVKSKKGIYTKGIYHTNGIEGYWSIIRRTIAGAYYFISKKHIHRYCKEFDFKYNIRNKTTEEKINLTLSLCDGRLRYKDLIK
jgi:transposase-like protein